jgi:hypothetical protein
MNDFHYLFVETHFPGDGLGDGEFIQGACDLALAGRKVTLWLLQNGVLTLFWKSHELRSILATTNDLALYADAFSMAQRSVDDAWIAAAGGHQGDMSLLVTQLMTPQCKVIWH